MIRYMDMCGGQLRVYENGAVFRLKGKTECVPTITNTAGYASVRLSDKNHLVHRLVAEAFIPNPENKPQVNHKDGNKRNNNVYNLEWVTAKENMEHAARTGLLVRRKTDGEHDNGIPLDETDLMKNLVYRVAKMPPELKQRFLDKAEGAAMALDTMQKENESTSADRERSGDNNS